MEMIFGTRGQYELPRPTVGRLRRRLDARPGQLEVVDRAIVVSGEVLYRASPKAHLDGELNRLRDAGRIVGKPVLKIRGNGQLGRRDDRFRVRERFFTRHRAVEAPKRRRMAAARRGQRLEAKRPDQLRGTSIPDVREEQRSPL